MPGKYNRKKYTVTALLLALFLLMPLYQQSAAAERIVGDVNGDGHTDFTDAEMIFNYVAGFGTLTTAQITAADINNDGLVTIADASQVFHFTAGLLSALPFRSDTTVRLMIGSLPDKLEYEEGEALDLQGMAVLLQYANGTSENLKESEYDFGGYTATAGVHIITVSYGEAKAAFPVTVYPMQPVSLLLGKAPDKLIYQPGETLDMTGFVLYGITASGSRSPISTYAVGEFNGILGSNTVTVTAAGMQVSFDVTVSSSDVGQGNSSTESSKVESSTEESSAEASVGGPVSEEPSEEPSEETSEVLPDAERPAHVTVDPGFNLSVRSEPNTDSTRICILPSGAPLTVIGEVQGEWYQVKGVTADGTAFAGWCYAPYIAIDEA